MSPEPQQCSPPLDVSTQRHRRHLGAYLRKFGAVIRKKTSGEDLIPPTTSDDKQTPRDDFTAVRKSVDNESSYSTKPPSVDSMDRSSIVSQRQPSVKSNPRSFESRYSVMTGMSIVSNVDRQTARQERAAFLQAKYGLSLSSDFPPERDRALRSNTDPLQRIQKRTRLRMHAFCHECKAPLGAGSHCSKCKHRRCRLCPRAAPKGVQQLVEQTRKNLQDIAEPPSGLDFQKLQVKESDYDYSQKSPMVSAGPSESLSPSPPSKLKMNPGQTVPTDYPDSPRTMESVLAARDPYLPRPLSMNMDIDQRSSFPYAHARDLCHTLDVATAKLCERQGFDLGKLQRLFPLSFRVMHALNSRSRQERVFRLPRIKIRVSCPGCGQPLPGRGGTCRMCMNTGFGVGGGALSAMAVY
ncbi:hypothetical protein CAC42_5434 [Sphaceloma murrayae]|uniref:Uncharacterized protein n=1 Tax=Sphaceloma murrayae TaxID=2082308 RepID=A0A2K1QV14_9PEZI|nr:hypothetical protein CAC42_5434 [Sphaceloma murrayae]